MIRERIDDNFVGLRKIRAVLVLAPSNVGQRATVSTSARTVHSAKRIRAETFGAKTKEVVSVKRRDALCETRDAGSCERFFARRANDSLPTRQTIVGVSGNVREHGEGQHHVDDFFVAVENREQILTQSRLFGNLLKEPDISVQAIAVTRLRLSTGPAHAGHRFNGG